MAGGGEGWSHSGTDRIGIPLNLGVRVSETHPELESEQAHVDLAYRKLDEAREQATRLKGMVEVGRGGTNQARWEREIFYENIANRLPRAGSR